VEDLGQDPHPRDDPGARAVATDPPRGADRLPAVVPWVLYSSYALAPGVLALTAQQDQTWGGASSCGVPAGPSTCSWCSRCCFGCSDVGSSRRWAGAPRRRPRFRSDEPVCVGCAPACSMTWSAPASRL